MKIAALISGGVDSSVALALLKQAGHDITAFYLKVWLEDELEYLGDCPWEEDVLYVERVCEKLDVPFRVLAVQQDYLQRVTAYALQEVARGRTPNPDILCNSRVKFGVFYERIDASFDKVATGHYANVRGPGLEIAARHADEFELTTTPDPIKDQTYFLAHLSQQQIARALFPIGRFQKKEVRELARKFDLPTQDRRDSQGLCFLGKISFRDFIKHHLGEQPGALIEVESGRTVGEHRGQWFYTIGQRQGLGLSGGPWYVAKKDPAANLVYISRDYFSPDKERDSFSVGETSWISGRPPESENLRVKLRHGEKSYAARVERTDEDRYAVRLTERDQGIAAGQFAVFYDGDVCLGCGVIQ